MLPFWQHLQHFGVRFFDFRTYVGLKFVDVWFRVDLGLVDLGWFRVSLGLACGLLGVYPGSVKGEFRFRSNIIPHLPGEGC